MKIHFHSRTRGNFDWEKRVIELHRLPCVGEYLAVAASGGEIGHHEIRLVIHVVTGGEVEAEIYCNRIGPKQMERLGWSSTLTDAESKTGAPVASGADSSAERARRVLTLAEASREAQVSVKTIRRRIAEGRLEATNYGTAKRADWRIAPEALASLKPIDTSGEIKTLPNRRGRRPRASSSSLRQHLASVLSARSYLPDA